jgi:hypothetical protein
MLIETAGDLHLFAPIARLSERQKNHLAEPAEKDRSFIKYFAEHENGK